MQRFSFIKLAVDLTNLGDSPDEVLLPEPQKVVPDSFADWLAQPSQVIAAPESEQGVFVSLLRECKVHFGQDQPHHRPR